MSMFITFFNLAAAFTLLFGGVWAFATFVHAVMYYTSPAYELNEAVNRITGKSISYPFVRRSIPPFVAALWLASAFLTGNLFP